MFVDKTIEELFKEKNSTILRDKLILDIGNNDDSLQLMVRNKIKLITSNTVRKINTLLKESNVVYDVKTLIDLFNRYDEKISIFVCEILDERKKFLSDSIISENKTSFQELSDSVAAFVQVFKSRLESGLDEIIHLDVRDDFLSKYIFKEEFQKEDLIMILERYDSELANSISEAVFERNTNLLNVFRETSEKVLELDNKTTGKVIEKK